MSLEQVSSDFITTQQLAAYLGLSEKTIYRWRVEKKGPPYFKPGGGEKSTVYYRVKDILKWEQSEIKAKK